MDLSMRRQWCVWICDLSFRIKQVISQQNLALPYKEGTHLSSLVVPESLDKFFDFTVGLQQRKAVFYHEILVYDDQQHPHILDMGGIRYENVYLIAAVSKDLNLHEELMAINRELTRSLKESVQESLFSDSSATTNSSGFFGETETTNYLEHMTHLNNELINMKRELVKKNAEISFLLEKREAMNRQLEELIGTKDMLFSLIAHDLRAPLAGTINLMDLVSFGRDSYEDAVEGGLFDSVRQSAQSTLQLLEDMLRWYRCSNDQNLVDRQPFDAEELTEGILSSFRQPAAQKNIRLTLNATKCAPAYGDPKMIASVLRNLLSNALKFTPNGGSIFVVVKESEDHCHVCVQDTGIGITESQMTTLFSVAKNKSTTGISGESGSGFGLILSRDMIELNQGTIFASSSPGEGTRVWFQLPLAEMNAE